MLLSRACLGRVAIKWQAGDPPASAMALRRSAGRLQIRMKSIVWLAAFPVLLAGLVTLPLPLPTGLPLIALSLVMVLAASPWAIRLLRRLRRRSLRLNGIFMKLEDRAPLRLGRVLKRTRPRIRMPRPENLSSQPEKGDQRGMQRAKST